MINNEYETRICMDVRATRERRGVTMILKKIRKLMVNVFGFCGSCYVRTGGERSGWFKKTYTRRQHTAYQDDKRNFFTGCKKCHEMNDEYWEEEWKNVPGYM